jgi:hypothetical protein
MTRRSDTRKKARRANRTYKGGDGGLLNRIKRFVWKNKEEPVVKNIPNTPMPPAKNMGDAKEANVTNIKTARNKKRVMFRNLNNSNKTSHKVYVTKNTNTTVRNEHNKPINRTANGKKIIRSTLGRSMTSDQIYRAKLGNAVEKDDEGKVSALLESGIVSNKVTSPPTAWHMTKALQIAVPKGNMNIIRKLLWAGANPLLPGQRGTLPFDIALAQEPPNLEVIKILYKHISNPANKQRYKNKYMEVMTKEVQEETQSGVQEEAQEEVHNE